MIDTQSLIRLQALLSPAFPTGAFSYSHGLEAAIANGFVGNASDFVEWLSDLVVSGPGWNDAVFLAETWRLVAEGKKPDDVIELALSQSFSKERHLETTEQGAAFLEASKTWVTLSNIPEICPLPVAVGAVAGRLNIDLEASLSAYLHAYISNQIQAALRLMKLGQQGGLEVLRGLEDCILQTASRSVNSSLSDLGSNTFMADIAAIQHESLQSRIFRS